ncbi:fructosamine-3-kinase [Anaerotaenia torta]|uniref:fructosamine kinase family protein n=1 Tax=Anaerotaenia torta TaxID=433293 RepID=UPI003D1B8883
MSSLINGTYNEYIEKSVTRYLNRSYHITNIRKNTASAMHEAAVFIGEGMNVFAKIGTNPFSYDQFTQEAWGLNYIKHNSPVKTPDIIDVLRIDGAALLLMEAIDLKPVETKKAWETLGQGLAALHRSAWDKCGLETHSYLGIFYQDNTPMDTWEGFYGERRLRDSMKMAVDAGNMTYDQCLPVEKLIRRLPEICGPRQPFSLLHGDPWTGNLLYDGTQLVLIDCGIYYGNREIDLSTVDFFTPVPEHFFRAYHEVYPIDPGYEERKALWQVNQWLGHVTLFGEKYMPKLMDAVNRYL